MFQIHNYGGFVAAILVFAAVPGAGTVAILDATARGGRRVGMAAVLGTLAGDFTMMLASVAGLAAVLQRNPQWLQSLQWFGVAYLGYLAWQMLRPAAAAQVQATQAVPGPLAYLRKACFVSLTNPKVMLFFIAFFPLFLGADAQTYTLPVMMAHVTLITALWQGGLVMVGNAVAQRMRGWPQARMLATRLGGVALLLLALRLAPAVA